MQFVLDPPHGVAPLRLGMTLDEAVAAVSAWGVPRVYPADAVRDFDLVSTEYDGITFQAALERDHRVTAVTVWGPDEDEDPDVQLLLDGLDVFRTPADEILAHAARKGWHVNNDDPRAPYIPSVTLAFTRDTSQEVPRDENGLPVHFTAVLVADERYREK
ncbi:hypothetical protein [Streptomyces bambusae]|uniref:Uncharacterized protein n=1 Tax=Streptomyces bambusae TaxID=1550616 RepID=A0ABS6Z796_9ACTN|nr:hypothetical protein [Streptomyces bambusae]MBW5483640.1 hypothetical protein [Streptomyces bambusae]